MVTPAKFERAYVLDTVGLIRLLTNDKKLGRQARVVIEAAEQGQTQLVISAVSVAELYYSNAKNGWFSDFAQLYADLESKTHIVLASFDADDVLDFDRDAAVPEMHDRIIVGLARRLGAPLLTSDPVIIQSAVVKTEW